MSHFVAAAAKSRASSGRLTRATRERVNTLSSSHRRRLDTVGNDDRGMASDEAPEIDLASTHSEEYKEPEEHGDNVLNGNSGAEFDESMDADGTKTPPSSKPSLTEVIRGVCDFETTRQVLEMLYDTQRAQDGELGRHGATLRAQGQQLSQVVASLPTKLIIFLEKGGSLVELRNKLGQAYDSGFFRGHFRGINNCYESPIYMDLTNPARQSVAISLVLQVDPELHPMVQGSTKVRRQNEQASACRDALIRKSTAYIRSRQSDKVYFDVSWPAGLQHGPHADSWSIGVQNPTGGVDILITCEYDHFSFEQEFACDLRVLKRIDWVKNDIRNVVDDTLSDYLMYTEKILWIDGRAPRLEVQGKQRVLPHGRGSGVHQADDTPAPAGEGFLAGKGIPPTFKGRPPFAHQQEPYKGQPQTPGHFQQKGGGGGKQYSGDFTCTECGEYNFARNAQCRKCFAPKPSFGQYQQTPAGFGLAQSGLPPPPTGPQPSQQRAGFAKGEEKNWQQFYQSTPQFPPTHPGIQEVRGKSSLSQADLEWMQETLNAHRPFPQQY